MGAGRGNRIWGDHRPMLLKEFLSPILHNNAFRRLDFRVIPFSHTHTHMQRREPRNKYIFFLNYDMQIDMIVSSGLVHKSYV